MDATAIEVIKPGFLKLATAVTKKQKQKNPKQQHSLNLVESK